MGKYDDSYTVTLPGDDGDEVYTFEPAGITVAEMYLLETELGDMTFDEWTDQVDKRRAKACQVLVWFLRHKAGKPCDLGAVDFPILAMKTNKVATGPKASAPSSPSSESGTSSSSPDVESLPGTGTD